MAKIVLDYSEENSLERIDSSPLDSTGRKVFSINNWPASCYDSYILRKFGEVEMLNGDAEDLLRSHRRSLMREC